MEKRRKTLIEIGHLVTTCPKCGVNNYWTRSRADVNGEFVYWQSCKSCGYEEGVS